MANPGPGLPGDNIEEAFSLYRRAHKLIEMGNAFASYVWIAPSSQ